MSEAPQTNDDDKFVVIKDGQRVSGLLSEQQANAEAARKRKLAESAGQADSTNISVKRNLLG